MRIPLRILRNVATTALAVAVIVVAMLWLMGVFRGGRIQPHRIEPPPAAASEPDAFTVRSVEAAHYADLVGSVQAEVRSAISAKILANILEVTKRAGDPVKEGEVLVVLDEGGLRARLNQASESLRAAEARRDQTRVEYERVVKMAEQKVATAFELEQWRAQHVAAVAEVARAQQAVSEAQTALADTILRSPITGIVIDRQAEPGDQASPGRPLLTVYDPRRLRLEASVREAFVGRLKVGARVPIFIDALGEQRQGTVQEIVPAADPQSRSFLVKVGIDNPSGLLPGMFGRVRLPLPPRQRLEVPLAAVERVGQISLVTALEDGRPRRRAVRLGTVDGDRVEVLAGLREGEKVLLQRPRS